jgi:quercetin dioxygenase-like cupin family protein
MKQLVLTFLTAMGIFGMTLGPVQTMNADAQALGHPASILSKAKVQGVDGEQFSVITLELAPGALESRHFHPGVELVYVLEGTGRLELDGEIPVVMNPGTVTALLPDQVHLMKNTSRTATLKVLVVYLLDQGRNHVPRDPLEPGLIF